MAKKKKKGGTWRESGEKELLYGKVGKERGGGDREKMEMDGLQAN